MKEELEKAYQDIWRLLEAGEWLNATIAAVRFAALDTVNKEYATLARCTRKIAEIADNVKGGSKRGAAARLEEISHALPQLKELDSFRALVELARYKAGKKGIVISVVVAVVFVMVCNLAGYQYLQAQPISSDAQRTVIQGWLGIQKLTKPVDILLLGDSTCGSNLTPGPVADRIGGRVINLGNTVGSSLLSDAWMLSAYVSKYGAPNTVILSRSSIGYVFKHSIETMENVPLPWAYWDKYGVIPDWKDGEVRKLFFEKYGVLYSDADYLSERLQCEWDGAVNAGLRAENLSAEKKYLSQFTDDRYVHMVDQVPKTLFTKEQMQSPNHLWHGSEKIYTEEIVNGITAIQSDLIAEQARNFELTSVSLDKDGYAAGDQPTFTLNVTDPGEVELTGLKGVFPAW